MVDVLTSILINATLQAVANYTFNPDNAPEWYVNIKSVEWKTEKPLRLGSQIAFVAYFLGKELRYTYEVVELTTEKLVMRTADGPFPMETTYSLQQIDATHTKMTLRNRGTPAGFSKLFSPFMAMMMKKANMKDLRAAKSRIEKS